jgi:hypothetical protein
MTDSHRPTIREDFDEMFRTALAVNITLVLLIPALVFAALLTCRG